MARRDRRRETTGALAVSILVHIVLLIVLAHQVAPGLRAPEPIEPDVQVQLTAQPPPPAATPPAERPRVSRRPRRQTAAVAPRPTPLPRPPPRPAGRAIQPTRPAPPHAAPAPRLTPSSATANPPATGAPAGSTAAGGGSAGGRWSVQGEDGQDGVRRFLRATVGCSHEDYVGLTEPERASCDRRVGRDARALGAAQIDVLPAAKRAYYEAVQQAYQSIHDPRPIFDAKGNQVAAGHPPAIGCKLGGKGAPANSLKAGPCFIAPPQGVLTEESSVPKPY